MDKLSRIAALCKCSVSLEYRKYADYYETLKERVGMEAYTGADNFLDGELQKCIETDKYWCLHFYPDTPIGFYYAFSSDLDKLLDWGLEVLEKENNVQP